MTPQPQAFVIALEGRDRPAEISRRNLDRTVAAAQRWAWNLTLYPAVDGRALRLEDWRRAGLRLLPRGAIQYRPGAQGCWFSHWNLWHRCLELGEPIIVLEHDAEITGPWPQNIDLDLCLWKLYRPDGRGDQINDTTGLWSRGSWAYTVTPRQAQSLIDFSLTNGVQAVDKQLGDRAVPWRYWHEDLCRHRPQVAASTTSAKIKEKFNVFEH